MSAKEKSKFEDMAKSDKARYDREMKKSMSLLRWQEGKEKRSQRSEKASVSVF